jgi:Pyruvate/2-oxoacid:ferredoxin oxidoreductase delta subunit
MFVLPPPMAGFFEFSMMRIRDDIDQQVLGELFYQYINVEEDFIKALFTDGQTQLGRVFVQEATLPVDTGIQVLDYERASEVISSASSRAVGVCYCRHKMEHVGKACDAPRNICMTFNGSASSLAKYGFAREVDVAEGLDLLAEAQEANLVQFGENIQQQVNFICNCCSCCCGPLGVTLKLGKQVHLLKSIATTTTDSSTCISCGACVDRCHFGARKIVNGKLSYDKDLCFGCGLCSSVCPTKAISLIQLL